ncbi:MAG: hypothetical protein POH28_06610 [Acidocella sp.]|nr:hypothetical protein [Acidocella sp.]
MSERQPPPEKDLNHAGSVVDKAIEYLMGQRVSEMAIASALLGGAMGLLTRSLPDEVVVQILNNAIDSIESGEMRKAGGRDTAGEA